MASLLPRRWQHPSVRWGIAVLVSLPLLAKVVVFADRFGGVDQDSGWYLGVAKNVAHRGIYASYTNAVAEESPGARPNIFGRSNVQDAAGFTYFPAGVTVGPGYVLPQAIALRLFGDGWWQYRLWPLAAYTAMLILLIGLAMRIGGITAAALLGVWLWFVPQLSITTAYEAFSEPATLVWLLLSFMCYDATRRAAGFVRLLYAAAGVFLSFGLLTKVLVAVAVPVYFGAAIVEIRGREHSWPAWITNWAAFAAGLAAPYYAFELYRYVILAFRLGESRLHFSRDAGLWGLGFGIAVLAAAVMSQKALSGDRKPGRTTVIALLVASVAAVTAMTARMQWLGDIRIDRRLPHAVDDEHYQVFVSCGSGATRVCEVRDALKAGFRKGDSPSQIVGAVVRAFRPEEIARKAAIFSDVGISSPMPSWSTVLPWIVLLVLAWTFRRSGRAGAIGWLLLGLVCVSQAWYLLLSETGWARHAYLGLVPHMLLLCCLPPMLWRLAGSRRHRWLIPIGTAALVAASLNTAAMHPTFSRDGAWADQLYAQRHARGMQGLPSVAVASLQDQKELVAFFADHIRPEDRVYYKHVFYVSEASSLVDKVFFTLRRYRHLDRRNPDGGHSYLIVGPYQRGKLAPADVIRIAADEEDEASGKLVFENPSYAIIRLP